MERILSIRFEFSEVEYPNAQKNIGENPFSLAARQEHVGWSETQMMTNCMLLSTYKAETLQKWSDVVN